MSELRIRRGEARDLEPLTELYNHYVRETAITFDVTPFTLDERRRWLDGFAATGPHQLFVAARDEGVLGFACSRLFREKAAYRTSVETSVYLRPGASGRGIGRQLYTALFAALEGQDVHRAIAGITLPNPASVALHARFAFERVGVFTEVGRKLGRYWDVLWMEKRLSAASARTA
jgi:phosphinothricin acetyltransferase